MFGSLIDFIRENIVLFDIIFLSFIIYFSFQCFAKGFFISLIEILEFVEQFKKKSKNLDEHTKNYVEAIKDKIEIILTNSGVEIFKPDLNKNVLNIQGCSSSLDTKKTKDSSKVNLIANVIKPGYRLQIKENEFIFLHNEKTCFCNQ